MIAPALQTDPVFQAAVLALIEAGAVVRASGDAAVQLWFDATHVAFVFHGASFEPEHFGPRMAALYAELASANVDVVIAGGPLGLYESAVDARPRATGQHGVGVVRVASDGAVEADRASKAVKQSLQTAFARGVPAPRPEGAVDALVADSLRKGQAQAEELSAFQRRLDAGRPLVTYGLVAAMVVLYAAQRYFGGETLAAAVRMGAVAPGRAWSEPWRLVAYAFLHGDYRHIAFNALSLISLGAFYERLLGPGRLLVIFALAAVGGGVASAIGAPQAVMVGASGAIWGMLGLSAALALRPGTTLPQAILGPFRQNTVMNLVIQVVVSMMPNVSFLAHLGGGLAGFALMLSGAVRPREGEASEGPRARTAGAVAGVAMAACVALALLVGAPWTLREPPALRPYRLGDGPWTASLPSAPRPGARGAAEEYVVADAAADGYDLASASCARPTRPTRLRASPKRRARSSPARPRPAGPSRRAPSRGPRSGACR